MKHLLTFVIIISTMLFLTSCNSISSNQVVLAKDKFIDKQIIFFTDENHVSKEVSYYDAIIELKKKYPAGLKNLTIVSSNTDTLNKIATSSPTYPAIIVVENNQITCKVEGEISKEKIVGPVSNAIDNWKKK